MVEWAHVLYCACPETALLAKCEDRACQGIIAEKSAILTDVEYGITWGRGRNLPTFFCPTIVTDLENRVNGIIYQFSVDR